MFRPSDLVKATEEEVSQAKEETEKLAKEKEEIARWSAIGRKPNEIKDGDIVVVESPVGSAPVGTLGFAEYGNNFAIPCMGLRDSNGKIWSFMNGVGLKLITPVEQRFDRKDNE